MDSLPRELIDTIKSFLDDRSRRAMRLASTKWFNIIHYDNFTYYFTMNEQLFQIYERLEKYNFPIRISFKKPMCYLTKEIYEFGTLTQLRSLNIASFKHKATNQDILRLTNLINLQDLDLTLSYDYLHHFSNLTNVICNNTSTEANLTNYSKIQSIYSFNDKSSAPQQFLFAPTNCLTKLELECNIKIDEDNWKRLSKLQTLIIREQRSKDNNPLIIPHLPNLALLRIEYCNYMKAIEFQPNLTKLKLIQCRSIDEIDTSTFSALTTIKHLHIYWTNYDTPELNFMTALTDLEKLTLNNSDDYENLLQYFNSSKLTAFKLLKDCSLQFINLNAPNLQRLQLSENSSLTPDILGNFTNLTKLCLVAVTTVRELLRTIETLTKLKVLHLIGDNDTPMNDIVHIHKLLALEDLTLRDFPEIDEDYNCHYAPLIDEASIVNLPLKKLTVSWSVNEKFFNNVTRVTSLQKLKIFNGEVEDHLVALLSGLTSLTYLAVLGNGAQLYGYTLTLLTSLQYLDVRPNTLCCDGSGVLPYLYHVPY